MKALHRGMIAAAVGGLSVAATRMFKGNEAGSSQKGGNRDRRSMKQDGVILNPDGSSDTPVK